MDGPLWAPSAERIAATRLTTFMRLVEERHSVPIDGYGALYDFSIARPEDFWRLMWEFGGVRGSIGPRIVSDFDRMPGARFFPDAAINFAGNLLIADGAEPALIFKGEERAVRTVSRAELKAAVLRFASALRREGIAPGDRVVGYLPNLPETIIAALGAAAIGAVWSSCSPDFGVQGVVDRFGQIEPKILVTADGYTYGGKRHDLHPRVRDIVRALPSLRRTVVVAYLSGTPAAIQDSSVGWDDFLSSPPLDAAELTLFPFNHPLYILYSSGTTGAPKCIVHGAGGTLLQHLKEHQLLCDIRPGDRVFYFTTCGWMMWNWLVTALASKATLVLYDGSPFHPDGNTLFDLADEADVTLFGTSAKFIDAVAKAGLSPMRSHRLQSVRTITSTGSPLAPESFDFVYEHVKSDVHLASISGGTDIVGLFAGGDPNGPVWRGEIQARALGMKVEVFDEAGHPVREHKGELVCTMPFPSMPVGFWNDPDGRKYRAAYFERFPGVWHHGDYVELTAHDGLVIYGRSDAVLNPGGVRIGTAEIYRQVEQLEEIIESLVIGQQWEGDERIVLFVRLRDGLQMTPELEGRIRRRIRDNSSPRHVPARILQVTDIPRTKSGKIVELAVRDVVHGREIRNREALANPEALDQFVGRPELNS